MLAVVLVCSGCIEQAFIKEEAPPTSAQQAYLDKVMDRSLDVTVSKAGAEEAWGRVQSFIGKYSSMKIQMSTDFNIQTYNAPVSESVYRFECGYSATKTPMGKKIQISVECAPGRSTNMFASNNSKWDHFAAVNSHIMANYVETGELPFPELIKR